VRSDSAFARKIGDEFRPIFVPTRVPNWRFDAARFDICFVIDFVPENFCRVGRDLMEITDAVVRRVFNRRIGAANQNGRRRYEHDLQRKSRHAADDKQKE